MRLTAICTFSDLIHKTDKLALTEAQRTRRNPGLKEFWDTAKSELHFFTLPVTQCLRVSFFSSGLSGLGYGKV